MGAVKRRVRKKYQEKAEHGDAGWHLVAPPGHQGAQRTTVRPKPSKVKEAT